MNWDLVSNFILAMLAILNPIGIIPLWNELAGDEEGNIQIRVAFLVTGTGLIILLIFLLSGTQLLNLFGIDLPSFQVAGGILLLLTGINMIGGEESKLKQRDEEDGSPFFIAKQRFRKIIVPLAVPMIAGPGSLTTVLIYGNKANSVMDYAALSVIVFITLAVLFFFFAASSWFSKKLDEMVFTIFTRIFGLIIAAIAVQLILEALKEVFPVLK